MRDHFMILFDPAEDFPPRGEQDVKDEAFEMAKDLATISGYNTWSDDFVEGYQTMERVLTAAETYRPHMYLLALHAVRHILRTDAIHLAHPPAILREGAQHEFVRESIYQAAEAIVEMMTQILFLKEDGMTVVSYDKLCDMPDFIRKIVFNFDKED